MVLGYWMPLVIVWVVCIGGCVWLAAKTRSRVIRIIASIGAAVCFLSFAGGTYVWLTLARPLPKPSGQEVAAAQAALDDLIDTWCADSWDEVWAQTAGLGKVEEKQDTYIGIWKSHKAEDFPSGVRPDEFADIRVYRPPISVFKIFLRLSLPRDAPETPEDINSLTTRLLREGMVCLVYRLKDEPYMNIIVNETGVWRPMTTPDGFPIGDWDYDFLDKSLARASKL